MHGVGLGVRQPTLYDTYSHIKAFIIMLTVDITMMTVLHIFSRKHMNLTPLGVTGLARRLVVIAIMGRARIIRVINAALH